MNHHNSGFPNSDLIKAEKIRQRALMARNKRDTLTRYLHSTLLANPATSTQIQAR